MNGLNRTQILIFFFELTLSKILNSFFKPNLNLKNKPNILLKPDPPLFVAEDLRSDYKKKQAEERLFPINLQNCTFQRIDICLNRPSIESAD